MLLASQNKRVLILSTETNFSRTDKIGYKIRKKNLKLGHHGQGAIRDPHLTFVSDSLWKLRAGRQSQSTKGKQGKCCFGLHFLALAGDQKWKQRLFGVRYTRTHGRCAIAKRHFLVRGGARKEGTRGHGNSGTPEGRRVQIGRDVESRGLKPKLKQTRDSHRGPRGPRGRSHHLYLGPWVWPECRSFRWYRILSQTS